MGAMGQEGKSARRSGSGVSNRSDMGISAAIRRGDHDRLPQLDQHHYSGGATSGSLEAAPARYFLDLRVRLGMGVTLRIWRFIEQVADKGAADLVTLRLQCLRHAAHAQKVDSILCRRALTPAANLTY